jgi:hypothetical protein
MILMLRPLHPIRPGASAAVPQIATRDLRLSRTKISPRDPHLTVPSETLMRKFQWFACAGLASAVWLVPGVGFAQGYPAGPGGYSPFGGAPAGRPTYSNVAQPYGVSFGVPAAPQRATPSALEIFSRPQRPAPQPAATRWQTPALAQPAPAPTPAQPTNLWTQPAEQGGRVAGIDLIPTDVSAGTRDALFTAEDQRRVQTIPVADSANAAFAPVSPISAEARQVPASGEQTWPAGAPQQAPVDVSFAHSPAAVPSTAQEPQAFPDFVPTAAVRTVEVAAPAPEFSSYAPTDVRSDVAPPRVDGGVQSADWSTPETQFQASPTANLGQDEFRSAAGAEARTTPPVAMGLFDDADAWRSPSTARPAPVSMGGSTSPADQEPDAFYAAPSQQDFTVGEAAPFPAAPGRDAGVANAGMWVEEAPAANPGVIQQTSAAVVWDEPAAAPAIETQFVTEPGVEPAANPTRNGSLLLQPVSIQPRIEPPSDPVRDFGGGGWGTVNVEWQSAAASAPAATFDNASAMAPEGDDVVTPRRYQRSAADAPVTQTTPPTEGMPLPRTLWDETIAPNSAAATTGAATPAASPFGETSGAFRPKTTGTFFPARPQSSP